MAEKYITKISEEIQERVIKNLSQEFSRMQSRFLGAKLDEFLLNPQVQICSVAVSGTSRSNNSENLEPTGDRSLNDTCPEVVFSACYTSNQKDSDQEEQPLSNISAAEKFQHGNPGFTTMVKYDDHAMACYNHEVITCKIMSWSSSNIP